MKRAADEVREVVANKCSNCAGHNDEKEVLIACTGSDTADNDRCFTRNDRYYRVEKRNDEDDRNEPICARCINKPIGELADDAVSGCGEHNELHL